MATEAKYLYLVRMDVEPDKEAEFNEIYNKEHIPVLLTVPGGRLVGMVAAPPGEHRPEPLSLCPSAGCRSLRDVSRGAAQVCGYI